MRDLYRKVKSIFLCMAVVTTLLASGMHQIVAAEDLSPETFDQGAEGVNTENAGAASPSADADDLPEDAAVSSANDTKDVSGDAEPLDMNEDTDAADLGDISDYGDASDSQDMQSITDTPDSQGASDSLIISVSQNTSVSQNSSVSQNTTVSQNSSVSQNDTVSQDTADAYDIPAETAPAGTSSGEEGEKQEGLRIEGLAESYPYTGYPITPEIHVYDGSNELICGRDYKLTWKNNVKAGRKANVTITFIGNYSHTPKQMFFEITTEKIEDADISVVEGVVNGKVQKLAPVIRYNGAVLKRNTDYTLRYGDSSGEGVPYKTAGTWKITVDGKGSFAGSSAEASEILHDPEDDRISLNNGRVGVKLSSKTVAISDGNPVPTVSYRGSVLTVDKDYTLEYGERNGAGKAAIVIRGMGQYCDVRTVTYKVTKENLGRLYKAGRVRVTVNDGAPVTIAKGGAIPDSVTVEVRADESSPWALLTEGKDYRLAFSNNRRAEGDGKVKITGLGLYAGSVTASFSIIKQSFDVLADRLFVGDVDASADKKNAFKKVKYEIYDLDDKKLQLNTDYTASFEQLSDTAARITLTGKGNYTDSSISREYRIITGKKSIQKAKIRVMENGKEVREFSYTGAPVVLDKSNIKLFIGRDEIPSESYDIESCMNNINKGKALITVRGTSGYSGLVTFKYNIGTKALQIVPLPGKKVMFVGDSRTIDMFSSSDSLYSGVVRDSITIYAKNGAGFGFFNNVISTCNEDDFDILVVWMGANDRGKFENYKAPYKKLLDKGKTLVLCTAGPTNNYALEGEDSWRCSEANIKAYNAALESWAKDNNVDVIDLYSYINKNISIGGDGLHYTPQPTTRIWDKILSELTQMKNRV